MSKTFLFQTIQFSQTVLIQKIQFSRSLQFSSIYLSGATILGPSGAGSNGNKRMFCILQNSSINGTSPSDCLVSYRTFIGGSYPSAEVQSVYSTAPADWAVLTIVSLYQTKLFLLYSISTLKESVVDRLFHHERVVMPIVKKKKKKKKNVENNNDYISKEIILFLIIYWSSENLNDITHLDTCSSSTFSLRALDFIISSETLYNQNEYY